MSPTTDAIRPEKALATAPRWSKPEKGTEYLYFNTPLEVGGIVVPRLELHGGCFLRRVDKHVTLELRFSKVPGRHARPLERIDWRSLTGHTNVPRDGSPSLPARVSETHLHAFEINWRPRLGKFWGADLPYAVEIEEQLDSFEVMREFAGKRFKINNIGLVPTPPWDYTQRLGEL